MYTKPARITQQSMFFDLESQSNQKHLLYLLANKMDWNVFKDLYFVNNAQVSQTLNYLPYGEDWVDIHSNLDYRLGQYTFNGKEKDSESGFHYYGARYYWSEVLTGWLSVDPMADKYPGISPYAYCSWNPPNAIDPNGMDSVRTPNGMANVGEGYKATPDGQYLYGEGLQPKRWNPNLEIGGIVGDGLCGGYVNCDNIELSGYGIVSGAAGNIDNLNSIVGVGRDGYFSYKRTKYDELAHGTARNPVKSIGKTIGGKMIKVGGNALSVILSANEVYCTTQEYGIDSRETYSAMGGLIGSASAIWGGTAAGAGVGAMAGGIGAVPGAVIGFAVGVVTSIALDHGGRCVGEAIYEKTHFIP